jgi:hypothetical protein
MNVKLATKHFKAKLVDIDFVRTFLKKYAHLISALKSLSLTVRLLNIAVD